MNSQKCKKEWDEQLYRFAIKRFGRMSNIGFYKMFLTPKDFIHDNYLAFISTTKAFDESETLQHYFNKFTNRIMTYKHMSYTKGHRQGNEYLTRGNDFKSEPNLEYLETKHKTTENYEQKLEDWVSNYKLLSLYSQGYTYIELAKMLNTYPVMARKKVLAEIKDFKKSRVFKEIKDDTRY